MSPERIAFDGCPVCGGEVQWPYTHGHAAHERDIGPLSREITWVWCKACGHVFTDGYFTDNAVAELYSHVAETQQVGHDIERRRWESARIVEKVIPFKSSGKWLDVGFGDGSLLFTAQEYGFDPVGVEVLSSSAESMESLNVRAFAGEITEAAGYAPFNVVSLMDVLEHVPFPNKVLSQVNEMLEMSGVLLLSTPRRDTVIWRALDNLPDGNPYYNEIEHYHCFDLTTVRNMLSDAGFRFERYGVTERYRSCMQIIATKVR